MSLDNVVEQLGSGWTGSKISRIENRKIGINTKDLRRLLDVYNVTDQTLREQLSEMARRASERGWWQSYGSGVIPSEYANLIGLEEEASTIRNYEPELVPGLLQTPDYAHSIIRAHRPTDTAEEIERRVEVRLERQQVLTRSHPEPPQFSVILNEGVLRRHVGGPKVMEAQLLQLAAERERENVVIQVLPFLAGAHAAMTGPFTILNFPDPDDVGIINVENFTGALALEKPHERRAYEDAWRGIQARALSPEDSRFMLKTHALR